VQQQQQQQQWHRCGAIPVLGQAGLHHGPGI